MHVTIHSDKSRYGRLVTVVEGFDGGDVDLRELVRTLRNKCATEGAAKGDRIELRGQHRKKATEVLEAIGYQVEVV